MLWWFLILGISLVLVVSVAVSLVLRVRKHMKASLPLKAEPDANGRGQNVPPEA